MRVRRRPHELEGRVPAKLVRCVVEDWLTADEIAALAAEPAVRRGDLYWPAPPPEPWRHRAEHLARRRFLDARREFVTAQHLELEVAARLLPGSQPIWRDLPSSTRKDSRNARSGRS